MNDCNLTMKTKNLFNLKFLFQFDVIFCIFQDEYNLNPGLEWEDEFTGRYFLHNYTTTHTNIHEHNLKKQ